MKEQPELEVVMVDVDSLKPYANNANIHSDYQVDQIANSILEFGFCDPIAVWTNEDGVDEIVEGHGRILAASQLGMREVPVIYLNALTDEQRRAYTHVHNQLTRNSVFDIEILNAEIETLDFDWESLGFDVQPIDIEEANHDEEPRRTLGERFGVAPFSVLNAREGAWQERKHAWIDLGIRSEIGRGGVSSMKGTCSGKAGSTLAVPGGSALPLNRR